MFLKQSNLIKRFKDDFNLNGISEVYFWKSQWEYFEPDNEKINTVSKKFIAFRLIHFLYFVGTIISTMTCPSELSIYFIYLTNLTFFVQAIYATLFLIDVLWVRFICQNNVSFTVHGEEKPKSRLLEKLIWILINIVNVIPYIVTIVYWSFLYTDRYSNTCDIVNNYLVHASNSVVALLDFMIIAVPIRRSHFIFPVLYGLAYGVFTVLYEVGGGYYGVGNEYIYSLIDWKNSPGSAVIAVFAALICAGLGHLVICWGLFKLRVYISQNKSDNKSLDLH